MIKILWIQPLFDLKSDNEAGKGTHYPLAALMLEAYSRDLVQSQWTILDFHHLRINDDLGELDNHERIYNTYLPNENFDIICISIFNINQYKSLRILHKVIREKYSSSLLIMGGHVYPQDRSNYSNFCDGLLIGDGEKPFSELLQAYDISRKNAVNYLENNEYWITKNRKIATYYHKDKNDFKRNFLNYDLSRNIIAPYMISYNCNYKCSFCIETLDYSKQIYKPLDLVKEEMLYQKSLGIQAYIFYDKSFITDKVYCKDLFRFMIENQIQGSMICANFHHWDDELLSLYRRVSFFPYILFHMDADCDKSLKYARKPGTSKQLKEVIQLAKNYGFRTTVICLIGYPQQTEEELYEVEKNLEWLNAHYYLVSELQIIEGTDLAKLPKPSWTKDFLHRRLLEIKKWTSSKNGTIFIENEVSEKYGSVSEKDLFNYKG
jgi:radical SAM superfamily enzyme YgiQ (UPF0313 family)